MTDTVPAFLTTTTTDATILAAMLATLPASLDQSQGSFLWDALAPAAAQLAQAAAWAQLVLQYGFVTTTFGTYLDLRATEQGLTRLAATAATGTVTLSGTVGTVIPAGTVVSTPSTSNTPAQGFATTAAATIPSGGSIGVLVQALTPGTTGNVGAGTITILVSTLAGITGVTNAAPCVGGTATETDSALLTRYLFKVQHPAAGGNVADYTNWALAVAGVGGVNVLPLWNGPGTVQLVLVDTNKAPASSALLSAVQAAIAPVWDFYHPAPTDGTVKGNGVTTDATQTDAFNSSAEKLVSDATYDGLVFVTTGQLALDFAALLPTRTAQAGIWRFRPSLKVSATSGTKPLVRLAAWNASKGVVCPTTPGGTTLAQSVLRGQDLAASFASYEQDFYWNGTDSVVLQVRRLNPAQVAPSAPTLSASGSGSTLAAGTYTVGYTWTIGTGETVLGTTATVVVTAGQNINVTVAAFPETNVPFAIGPDNWGSSVDGANLYVSIAANNVTTGFVEKVTAPGTYAVTTIGNATPAPATNTAGGDTSTSVWYDRAELRSTFTQDTGQGKAPIGAAVSCQAATAVPINVAATLTLAAGYDPTAVHTALNSALTAYLQAQTFAVAGTIHYAVIGATILGVAGVTNYTGFTVNGGTADVTVSPVSVATLGTTTWS